MVAALIGAMGWPTDYAVGNGHGGRCHRVPGLFRRAPPGSARRHGKRRPPEPSLAVVQRSGMIMGGRGVVGAAIGGTELTHDGQQHCRRPFNTSCLRQL